MLSRTARINAYRQASIVDEIAGVIADWLETEPTTDPDKDFELYSCERAKGRTFTFGYVETIKGTTYLTLCNECGKELKNEGEITSDGTFSWCSGCAPRYCEFCSNKLTEEDIAYDGSILDWCNDCIPW